MKLIVQLGKLEHVLDVKMGDLTPGFYYRSSTELFYPEDEDPPWRKANQNREMSLVVGRHIQVMELVKDEEGRTVERT